MELSEQQIEYIRQVIQSKGITMTELADSIVDHICCSLENSSETDFKIAFEKTLDSFGKDGFKKIQMKTEFLITFKNQLKMKKTMFVLGYISVSLISTGILFKSMHWPATIVFLVLGVVVLNFGFLPLYFIDKYKQAKRVVEG